MDETINVPERLTQWHWVNLFEESGYRKLVHALNTRSIELGITPASGAHPGNVKEILAGTVEVNLQDGEKYVWIPPVLSRWVVRQIVDASMRIQHIQ